MSKQRLEAFTDGVIAIAITIMVLDLKVPPGTTFASLASDIPVLLAYTLSFANVGIFWNNHHHMLHATERINGMVLWANLFLLFWISLVPFAIRWTISTSPQRPPQPTAWCWLCPRSRTSFSNDPSSPATVRSRNWRELSAAT
jgi:uncharacterized membrane protein